MTGNRIVYTCARCKKDKLEFNEVVNMGNFDEDQMFFIYVVPKRYRLNFHLCNKCFNQFKKTLKRFMECEE